MIIKQEGIIDCYNKTPSVQQMLAMARSQKKNPSGKKKAKAYMQRAQEIVQPLRTDQYACPITAWLLHQVDSFDISAEYPEAAQEKPAADTSVSDEKPQITELGDGLDFNDIIMCAKNLGRARATLEKSLKEGKSRSALRSAFSQVVNELKQVEVRTKGSPNSEASYLVNEFKVG